MGAYAWCAPVPLRLRAFAAWEDSLHDVAIVLMIEKKAAVDNLSAILDVEWIDMVQFGRGDYSVSIGKPGDRQSEETQGAYRNTIDLALKKSMHPRIELAGLEQAKQYLDMDVRHFCTGCFLAFHARSAAQY